MLRKQGARLFQLTFQLGDLPSLLMEFVLGLKQMGRIYLANLQRLARIRTREGGREYIQY